MSDLVLIMNLRGSSWDYVPDDLWLDLLRGELVKLCDGIGFDTVADDDGISRFRIFSEHRPILLKQVHYRPFDVPVSAPDPGKFEKTIALFEFNSWIASLLANQPFNEWHISNEESCADELLFWAKGDLKVRAVPYEGQIFFYSLTASERHRLVALDKRIEVNLHAA